MTLADIAEIVGGEVVHAEPGLVVTGDAFVDSRQPVPGGLYVAVLGEHMDGHDFVESALTGGASAALVTRQVGQPAVVVPDAVVALGQLASAVVSKLAPGLSVIGITGSQGKTSTKDLLAQVLESAGETIAPFGSFNNELGGPLTALRASESTGFLLVEMGARSRGDIEYLASLVHPSVGLVLNVGLAHLGEFGTRAGIAAAKGELVESLPPSGLAVLNADDPLVAAMRARTRAEVSTFGESLQSDVRLADVTLDAEGRASFVLHAARESVGVQLLLVGEHQAHNAAAAAAVALGLGVPLDEIAGALAQAQPRSRWRMEVGTNSAGVTVINDAYNANPDSMRAALKSLAEIGHRRGGATRTFAVLGEMLELGEAGRDEHDGIGRLVVRLDISQLVVVGEGARPMHLGASLEGSGDNESLCVRDAAAAVDFLQGALREGDVVLVKASRAAGLEVVAQALLDDVRKDGV